MPIKLHTYGVLDAINEHFDVTTLDVVLWRPHVEHITTIDEFYVWPGLPTFPHNLSVQLGTVGFLDIVDGDVKPRFETYRRWY